MLSAIDKLAGVKPVPKPSPVVPTTPSVDKSGLSDLIKKAPETRQGTNYTGATSEAQTTYDDAIKQGQIVLDDTDASQNEVDKAKAIIERAEADLQKQQKPIPSPVVPAIKDKTEETKSTIATENLRPTKKSTKPKLVKKNKLPAKQLPQTGETTKANTWLGFGVIGLLLAVLGIKKKKEDE